MKAKDIEEIYDLRRVLEGLAAEKAALLMQEKDLKKYGQIAEMMAEYETASRNELDLFLKADLKLHSLILSTADNQRLIKILTNLFDFINSFRIFDAQQGKQRIVQAHDEHKKILKALVKKDAGLARSLLEQHIENAKRNILADFMPGKVNP